jgi:hypothetical protein
VTVRELLDAGHDWFVEEPSEQRKPLTPRAATA